MKEQPFLLKVCIVYLMVIGGGLLLTAALSPPKGRGVKVEHIEWQTQDVSGFVLCRPDTPVCIRLPRGTQLAYPVTRPGPDPQEEMEKTNGK